MLKFIITYLDTNLEKHTLDSLKHGFFSVKTKRFKTDFYNYTTIGMALDEAIETLHQCGYIITNVTIKKIKEKKEMKCKEI